MLPAILGGVGLLGGILGNSQKAREQKAQMMARAAEQEAQPWTGQGAQTQANFDGGSWGNLMQGAVGGAGLGQSINAAGQQQDMNSAWLDLLKKKAAPSGDMMASPQEEFAFSPQKLNAQRYGGMFG